MPPYERSQCGDTHEPPAKHPEPGRRHMQKHDLYRGALLVIVGRIQRAIESDHKQDDRHRYQPGQQPIDDTEKARRVRKISYRHARSLIDVVTVRISFQSVCAKALPISATP